MAALKRIVRMKEKHNNKNGKPSKAYLIVSEIRHYNNKSAYF